jgi:ATP-dependent DNA ligase
MLCHTAAGLGDVPEGWVMEPKLDGWRWTVVVEADRVRSYAGRNGSEHTGETPAICAALAHLPVGTVLDGEIVGGESSGGVSTGLAGGAGAPTLQLVVFDLLQLGSHDLRRSPLSARRSMLETVFAKLMPADRTAVILNPQTTIDAELFATWLDLGLEGAVCKRPESVYHPGKRSRDWLKVKPMQTADAEIIALHPGKPGGWNENMVGRFEIRMLDTGVITAVAPNNPGDCQDAKDHPERWLGKVIEIRYQLMFDGGQPRHPVFSRMRPDLDPCPTAPSAADRLADALEAIPIGTVIAPKPKPTSRRAQRMNVMRNYRAMALPKLAKCVAELEAQQGDAYDRVIAKDGDPAADLEVAKGVLAGKAAP